jgi:hypothetical protein
MPNTATTPADKRAQYETQYQALAAKANKTAYDRAVLELLDKAQKAVTPAPDGSDPKALAEWEWDNKPDARTGYTTKDRYVAIRTREISGDFRAMGDTRVKRQ